jgi:hypothetical protein
VALVVEDGTGKADAEALISVAGSDEYFTSKRGPSSTYSASGDWLHAGTTEPIKEACLRWGMRLIAKLWRFDGERSSETQALPIPREGMEVDDVEVESDVVPADLAYANAEMARALLLDATRTDDTEKGLSSLKVDVIQLVFDRFDRKRILPPSVRLLLADYGRARSSAARLTERV